MKPLSERVIEAIIGFDPWLEENKINFFRKYNPEYLKKYLEAHPELT